MSIKARLVLNALLVILGISAIAAIGLKSIFAIKASVDQLTHNSTPQQVKTIQIQQAVEKLSAEFLRLGMASNVPEARQISGAVKIRIEEIKRLGEELKQLEKGSDAADVSGFEHLHQTVAQAVRAKLTAIRSFQAEAEHVSRSLHSMEASLAGIHQDVASLNAGAFDVVRSAQQSNLKLSTAVKKALNIQYHLKEIEAILSEIDATRSKYRLTPFKEKIKAVSDAVQNMPSDPDDPTAFKEARAVVASLYDQIMKEPGGLIALKVRALAAKEGEGDYTTLKTGITTGVSSLSRKLAEVVDPLELQMLKSRQAVEHSLDLQKQAGLIVGDAVQIEVGAKELDARVRLVMLSDSVPELERQAGTLQAIQGKIVDSVHSLQGALNATGRKAKAGSVDAIASAIREANASTGQIVAAKRHVLLSDALMQKTFRSVKAIAIQQTKTGDERLKGATQKQNDTVANVNERVQSGYSLMMTISAVAILLTIVFSGLLIFRITRPLNMLSGTVLAVASDGDFARRVPLGGSDEVGKTVRAFNHMMDSLQAAFAGINTVMDNVSHGDFTRRVDIELKGDLHALKGSINASVDSLQLAIARINSVMEGVSKGDFARQIDVELSGELDTLKQNINASVDSVRCAIRDINQVMSGLSIGDFSKEITVGLEGELGTLKRNINETVATLRETLTAMSVAMSALAGGDFDIRVDANVEGEFKKNLDMTLRTMATLDAIIGDINRVMSNVAQGDLTPRVLVKAEGDLQRLADGINTSLEALQHTLRLVHENTLHVSVASVQTSVTAAQVAEGVQSQTGAVGQLVQSIGHTTQAITHVLENTDAARRYSQQSAEFVRAGQESVRSMLDHVLGIADNSNRIGTITEVITNIAHQTQLLALNATIEAARAGDHGRGFAVVAHEINTLAEQVSRQVLEINTLIRHACDSSQDGVAVANAVSQEMDRIVQNVLSTDEALRSITTAMEQQTGIVQKMQTSVDSLQTIAVTDAAAAQQMTASMSELSRLADQTREQIEQFQVA